MYHEYVCSITVVKAAVGNFGVNISNFFCLLFGKIVIIPIDGD